MRKEMTSSNVYLQAMIN